MFNIETHSIEDYSAKQVPPDFKTAADRYPIITDGRDTRGYNVEIEGIDASLDPIPPDAKWGLQQARLSACSYLVKKYGYSPSSYFKSICFANGRDKPVTRYIKVVNR
ncbi:hypothetical protein [Sporosarcina beigongshangi]|uniref:hypothetical protein n=1 Tax=Sporosarcina beigongshangi TaxID=2782538 RepID=UPI00193A32D0|nr:hypothetical protein [Sporosarcina beigongshangi]